MRSASPRWTALLALALLSWLWLSAVHVHPVATSSSHAAHAVCELCAGIERGAPPPMHGPVLFLPAPFNDFLGPVAAAAPLVATRAPYASRAPPHA